MYGQIRISWQAIKLSISGNMWTPILFQDYKIKTIMTAVACYPGGSVCSPTGLTTTGITGERESYSV